MIADLPTGAEAFGFLSDGSAGDPGRSDRLGAEPGLSLLAKAVQIANADPETDTEVGAVIAAVRLDRDPRPDSFDYPGYDMVLVYNPRTSALSNIHFGAAIQPLPVTEPNGMDPGNVVPYHAAKLRLGGWRNDPVFGGDTDQLTGAFASGAFEVCAFLVPEDSPTQRLNFTLSATATPAGGGDPVIYRKETPHFQVGDYLVISFDADVPVYDAEWFGPDGLGADGNWNVAANWDTTGQDGTSVSAVPNNSTLDAYNVGINLGTAIVTPDTSITIDRLTIGDDNGLSVENGRPLILEKFYVREVTPGGLSPGCTRHRGRTVRGCRPPTRPSDTTWCRHRAFHWLTLSLRRLSPTRC